MKNKGNIIELDNKNLYHSAVNHSRQPLNYIECVNINQERIDDSTKKVRCSSINYFVCKIDIRKKKIVLKSFCTFKVLFDAKSSILGRFLKEIQTFPPKCPPVTFCCLIWNILFKNYF